jgi:hypothetical protein
VVEEVVEALVYRLEILGSGMLFDYAVDETGLPRLGLSKPIKGQCSEMSR